MTTDNDHYARCEHCEQWFDANIISHVRVKNEQGYHMIHEIPCKEQYLSQQGGEIIATHKRKYS